MAHGALTPPTLRLGYDQNCTRCYENGSTFPVSLLGLLALDLALAFFFRFTFGLGAFMALLFVLFVLELQGLLGFGRDDRLAHDLRGFARGPLGIADRFDLAVDNDIDRSARSNFEQLRLHELQHLDVARLRSKDV